MRRSLSLLFAGLVLTVTTGCPKKTTPGKTGPEGGVTKTGDEGGKTGAVSKTKTSPPPPRKPAFVPPATRNLTLDLKVRTLAGETDHLHELTLVRTPVNETRRVRFAMDGLPRGKTQQLELEVAGVAISNGTDASLLGFMQQVLREGRRLLPQPGGQVVYLPGGGVLQQKSEKPKDVSDSYSFAGRDCHGKRISSLTRGWLAGGEPFKGRVNLELWRDPETAEVLALKGTATMEFRDQGKLKLTYRLEASIAAPGVSGGDAGEFLQAIERPEKKGFALATMASLTTTAALATKLQKDPGGWLPAGMLASAIAGAGSLHVNAKASTITAGRVQKKRAEPERKIVSYQPTTQVGSAGATETRLVPTVFTDDADYLIRFGTDADSRVVRVSKAEYDRARAGDPFDLTKAEVEKDDPPATRPATAEEVKLLEAARKAGKPVHELK